MAAPGREKHLRLLSRGHSSLRRDCFHYPHQPQIDPPVNTRHPHVSPRPIILVVALLSSLGSVSAFAQAAPSAPPASKTAAQDEALDLLAEVAEELCYEMPLRPGDLQLLNSHVTYHARTAYEDDAANGQDRLLYRLWLSMPNSRALPRGFEVLWGRIEAGALRGGVDQV